MMLWVLQIESFVELSDKSNCSGNIPNFLKCSPISNSSIEDVFMII